MLPDWFTGEIELRLFLLACVALGSAYAAVRELRRKGNLFGKGKGEPPTWTSQVSLWGVALGAIVTIASDLSSTKKQHLQDIADRKEFKDMLTEFQKTRASTQMASDVACAEFDKNMGELQKQSDTLGDVTAVMRNLGEQLEEALDQTKEMRDILRAENHEFRDYTLRMLFRASLKLNRNRDSIQHALSQLTWLKETGSLSDERPVSMETHTLLDTVRVIHDLLTTSDYDYYFTTVSFP